MRTNLSGIFLSFYLFFTPLVYAEESPQIEQFSPQGTAKAVRQVTARFSSPMVPFGDPRGLIDPFDIRCSGMGTGRWADGKNWVFDFEKDLPAGIRCEFRLKPGLKTLSGEEIGGQREFFFSAGGPNIKTSTPPGGAEWIDEEQVFILVLDGEPDPESVLQQVTFSVEGIQDRVETRIIEGKERERILKTRYRKIPEQPILLIQSKQRFPAEAKVSLVWGKGIMSKTGVQTIEDQVLHFKTRKPFHTELQCQRENPRAGCIPIKSMTLQFSSPISAAQVQKILLKGPGGKIWKPGLEGREVRKVTFKGPFPEKANFSLEIPPGLKDDAGRLLINGDNFPLFVQTNRYPPLAKFSSRFGILELRGEPVLPVTVRNLESPVKGRRIDPDPENGVSGSLQGKNLEVSPKKAPEVQAWLRKVASASRESSILKDEKGVRTFQVPKPMGARAFEVVGIPLKKAGLHVVELESTLLGKALLDPPKPMFVPTAVLVTNLSVHFKWGRDSSLVWVTTLDKGEPVPGASVTVRDCQERVLWQGLTDHQGIARIVKALPSLADLPRCQYEVDSADNSLMGALRALDGGLFVMAQTPEDMAFVHSSWSQGIEPWRFQLPEEDFQGPVVAHTIFDRTLLRAGETVHMKHILRHHTTKGLALPPQSRMPNFLSITHAGSNTKHEFPLNWYGNGFAESTWQIPRETKLGTYEVFFLEKIGQKQQKEWTSGEFRVEEFRVPLLKAIIQPPKEPLINAPELSLLLNVQYLSGGGATQLPVKLRGEIVPKGLAPFEGFENFVLANGSVKEGRLRQGEPVEMDDEMEEGGGVEKKIEAERIKLPSKDLTLDSSGSAQTTIANIPKFTSPKEIVTELEFKDPNGEVQTVSSRIPLWPSKYLIGIKADTWTTSKGPLNFQVAVLDLSGRPVSNAPVKVHLLERKTYTHRKRLVGGFYAYEHTAETKKMGPVCEGKTDSTGLLLCEARSPVSGNLILQAQSSDDGGNETTAHTDVWVASKDEWWFEVGDYDRMDLLPEKRRYEPGETAGFQVRMPFREATALIAVEREGVMEAFVQKISGKRPVIEIPIKGAYAPNVFVSVLALRGRIGGVKLTAMVDLGKPAYKLGIAEVKVGWRDHELRVSVSPERSVYKVRQKVKVKVAVKTMDGKIPPPGSEIALAAVDEGLMELMPNRSWQILPAMMGRRGYGVNTSTAQAQVIGKRHFGLKALPPGGGGGRQLTRELFDTLLFWKARLPLDANGEVLVEFPLNDSITSFRIVAVATAGENLFGTGSASIQSTQDLMILSGLAPLVREGDRFRGEFTVRNTTSRPTEVEVLAKLEGISKDLDSQILSLRPGEAKEIGWNMTAPLGLETLRWEVGVSEKGSPKKDQVKVTQRIIPVTPVRTYQATIGQIEKGLAVPVEQPKGALPG